MEYVLLTYGAAFVATGFALGVQARAAPPTDALPSSALWALTAFALVHGASEWAELALFLEQRAHAPLRAGLAVARLGLLATSFALLLAFGLLLVTRVGVRPGRALAVALPAAALLAWLAGAAVAFGRGGALDRPGADAAEAATRYLLGVPACAAAFMGLDRVRRSMRLEGSRASRLLGAACVAVACYAFFTGLVVPRAEVGLATSLNRASFVAATRVPVEVFRTVSIAAIGLLVSEVFVLTTSRHLRSEVEHLRDEFISLVAHDLRTPLGTVKTAAMLLERLPREEHGSEREARFVKAINASVRTMTRIVNDLLDASRIESRRLAVAPEWLDLTPLLLGLIEWAPADAVRGHTVRLVPPGPLPPVIADPVRVEQVLANLLSNAGKYSSPGSEIVLEARADPDAVTLAVTNTGVGIAPRDLPHVFERHYRTRTASAGKAPGLGLGLYIARGLVEAQGGRIWAESTPGRQTTFFFTVPRARERRRSPRRAVAPASA